MNKHTSFNTQVYLESASWGAALMAINTSHLITRSPKSPNVAHMERASWDAAMMLTLTWLIISSILHYTLSLIITPELFPGRLYPGRVFRATTPVDSSVHLRHAPRDSEVPRTASTGPLETPYETPGLPCITSTVLYIYISSPLPRKGGYHLKASLRRSDDRPDLSDLGWSSHWEAHAKLSGPSDRPVSSNLSIIEHI